MSGAVCPSCGVAVMPGYARCPKCRARLPQGGVKKGVSAGGTALDAGARPIVPIVAGVVVLGAIIALAATRGGKAKPAAVIDAPAPQIANAPPAPRQPTFEPVTPTAVAPIKPSAPSPDRVAQGLKATLSRQRLWSDIDVTGATLSVTSGSCDEPAMAATIDGAAKQLGASGLKTVRCLDKSGRAVFEKSL